MRRKVLAILAAAILALAPLLACEGGELPPPEVACQQDPGCYPRP